MFNVSIEVNIICCLLHNLGIIVVKHYQQHYMTIPFIFLLSSALFSKFFYPRKFQSSVHLVLMNCWRLHRVFLLPLHILFEESQWCHWSVYIQSQSMLFKVSYYYITLLLFLFFSFSLWLYIYIAGVVGLYYCIFL